MPDHLDSVKEYVRLMQGWQQDAAKKSDAIGVQRYEKRISFLRATVEELENFRRITKPIPATYGDLSDLPPELMKELSGVKVDELEQQIYTIIKSGGADADLDAVLIELFRRFKVVQTRKFLQNKLWRMAQKELIFSVPSRKGVYSAIRPKDEPSSGDDAGNKFLEYGAATQAQPSRGGFADDLDDDVPF
jgi:hypothetical protein